METRQVTQIRVYVLYLNTFDRAEDGAIAAISTSYDDLVRFYNENLLSHEERYRDAGGMYISFKEGPLQYFNPCGSLVLNDNEPFGHGIHDEWINEDVLHRISSQYFMVQ